MKSPKVVLLSAVAAIALVAGALALREKKPALLDAAAPEPAPPVAPVAPPAPPPPAPSAEVPAPAAPPARPPAPAAPAKSAGVSARDEAALMTQLRDLGGSNPELSLRLAREGSRKFGDSADAPERTWFIVRSLTDLGRVDEARAEARVLLDKYPDSSWAQDVHRHMFVNPPTHPLERGYGKKLELE